MFDAASIEALIGRLRRVLVAMTADPDRRLSSMDVLDEAEHARLDEIGNRAVLPSPQTTADCAGQGLRVGELDSWNLRPPLWGSRPALRFSVRILMDAEHRAA